MGDVLDFAEEFVVRNIVADIIGIRLIGEVPLDRPIPSGNGQFHQLCEELNREFPEVRPCDLRHCETIGDVVEVTKRVRRA